MSPPDMEWVDSSNIEAIAYEADERALYVQFHGGRTYRYEDVPPEIHAELMNADSKGSYFNRELRDNYECSEV